jgi:hypothetical protein
MMSMAKLESGSLPKGIIWAVFLHVNLMYVLAGIVAVVRVDVSRKEGESRF